MELLRMGNSLDAGTNIKCHPFTSNPNEAWEKLKSTQVVQRVQPLPLDLPISPDSVRFVCMADTHSLTSHIKEPIPPGDVFLHAGDFTRYGLKKEVEDFNRFLGSLPHKHKIVIAGNHELTFDPSIQGDHGPSSWFTQHRKSSLSPKAIGKKDKNIPDLLTNCIYLEDSGTEIYGISVYGTPWQPVFNNWAFNLPRGKALLEKWNKIPSNVDVLLTHSPPIGHGDFAISGMRTGCVELLSTVQQRVKPKYHVFGHIHEGYGVTSDGQTVFINCSTCDVHYMPVNRPVIFDIPLGKEYTKC